MTKYLYIGSVAICFCLNFICVMAQHNETAVSTGYSGPGCNKMKYINIDNTCPEVGQFAIAGECTRFYDCLEQADGALTNNMAYCPKGFNFDGNDCVPAENQLQCFQTDCIRILEMSEEESTEQEEVFVNNTFTNGTNPVKTSTGQDGTQGNNENVTLPTKNLTSVAPRTPKLDMENVTLALNVTESGIMLLNVSIGQFGNGKVAKVRVNQVPQDPNFNGDSDSVNVNHTVAADSTRLSNPEVTANTSFSTLRDHHNSSNTTMEPVVSSEATDGANTLNLENSEDSEEAEDSEKTEETEDSENSTEQVNVTSVQTSHPTNLPERSSHVSFSVNASMALANKTRELGNNSSQLSRTLEDVSHKDVRMEGDEGQKSMLSSSGHFSTTFYFLHLVPVFVLAATITH